MIGFTPFRGNPNWTPHNKVGHSIEVEGFGTGRIIEVKRPESIFEAERIVVEFPGGNQLELVIRVIKIGGDVIK